MTKISSLTALTGAGADTAVDLVPVIDMSETGAARNKKMTLAELKTALGVPTAYTDEQVRDVIGAALQSGTNITVTPNDGSDTITIDAAGGGLSAEQVMDTVAAMLTQGSNVTLTYNDGADTLTIAAAGGGGGVTVAVEDEGVEELASVARLNFSGAGVSVTVVGSEAEVVIPGGGGVSQTTGSWTPALKFGGASVGMTYSVQVGRYIRTGDLVVAQCYVQLSAKGSSTGTATIEGLPFTSRNITNYIQSGATGLVGTGTAGRNIFFRVGPNATVVNLWDMNASVNADDADFTGSAILIFTMSYECEP